MGSLVESVVWWVEVWLVVVWWGKMVDAGYGVWRKMVW